MTQDQETECWGKKTKRAIRRYEAEHNWPITGLISTGLTERLRSETQDRLALNEPKEVPLDSKKNQASLEQEIVDIKRSIQELQDQKPQDSKGTKDSLDLIGQGSTFAMGVLGIVLALMTLGGYAVYRLIKFTLETKHDKLLADGAIKIRAIVYMNLSRAFYLYYRSFFYRPDYLTHPGFQSGVELALWFCEHTLVAAGGWGDEVPEKPDVLMTAKAHRAYHQATKKSASDIKAALSVVEQLTKYATQLFDREKIERWAEIRETIAWIFINSGDPQKEADGKIIINDLLQNDRISQKVKDEIKQNYDKVGVTI